MRTVRVYNDPVSLARAGAILFAACVKTAVVKRGRALVALCGGQGPIPTYRRLAAPPWNSRIEWSHVHIFWSDERCVAPTDPNSNQRVARETLLDHVAIPADQIHPIECSRGPQAETGSILPDALSRIAACEYGQRLRDVFANGPPRFDLMLLGLGEDGHTASLFPGDPAVQERGRWVVPVAPTEDRLARVSFTLPLINAARTVVFIVSGARKFVAVRRVLGEPHDAAHPPARLVRPHAGRLIWLLDREAAQGIEEDVVETGSRFMGACR